MKIRCGKSSKKVGYKDWKIIVFEMGESTLIGAKFAVTSAFFEESSF
jgi:hypothetical protein